MKPPCRQTGSRCRGAVLVALAMPALVAALCAGAPAAAPSAETPPADAGRTELPVTLDDERRYWITAKIVGEAGGEAVSARLLVDPGAAGSSLTAAFVESKLKLKGQASRDTANPAKANTRENTVTVAELQLGSLRETAVAMAVAATPDAGAQAGDGVLGANVLGSYLYYHTPDAGKPRPPTGKLTLQRKSDSSESWTVVVYEDKSRKRADPGINIWDNLDLGLKMQLQQNGIGVQIGDPLVPQATFAELLSNLKLISEQNLAGDQSCVWTFEVTCPTFKRIVFPKHQFSVDWSRVNGVVTDGAALLDGRIAQTWRVTTDKAPPLLGGQEPELAAEIDLGDGIIKTARVRVNAALGGSGQALRPGSALESHQRTRKLILTYAAQTQRTQILKLFQGQAAEIALGIAREPMLFVPASAIIDPRGTKGAHIVFATTEQEASYYYIATADTGVDRDGRVTPLPGMKWRKWEAATKAAFLAAGGDPKDLEDLRNPRFIRVDLFPEESNLNALAIAPLPGGKCDVRLLVVEGNGYKPTKITTKVSAQWASEMLEQAKSAVP